MVRISELTFLADSGILALALVTAYVSATIHYPANFSSVIQSVPYRLPYFGYSIWHLWGNLLDAPLSGGSDIDNFLLDAYCWYGRHYESRLHPPFSASLNFHSADGSQRTANRLVLHPTPEGPFHERSFSCMMQTYTARHFMAQPVFPIYELEIFPVVVAIRAWSKIFTGKVVFHYLDSVASRSDFIL